MRILRAPEVVKKIGYSRMHIYRLEQDGRFPKRVRLGANAIGWLEHEVEDWLKDRVAERDCPTEAT